MTDISLDEILSGDGNAMPETTTTEVQQPADTGQQRDEQGRFAAKADAPVIEFEQPGEPITTDQMPQHGEVPVGAVKAEREKRQAAQAEAETLRRELAELRGQVTLLTQQRQPAEQTPQQEQQPPALWDDPDGFIKSQLTPFEKQMADMREFMSENMAVQQFGAEKVEAAKQAIEQAARTPEGQQIVRQMMQSRHPYGDLMQWHQRQQALATVGNDPQAWLQAELEKRMADPAFQAQVIERARGGAVQNGNRQQPVTSLPPSLSRIPTGGNAAEDNDMSDGALFAHATR